MTKCILSCLLLFIAIHLTAQKRIIVIQIDTVKSFNQDVTKLKTQVTNQGFLNLSEEFDSSQTFNLNKFPNYLNTITIKSDSSNLQLSIGNGNYIEIINLYSSKEDTLRINKFEQYPIHTVDTTVTIIEYYKMKKGKLNKTPFKTKKQNQFDNSKEVNPPNQITLDINGKNYLVNLFKSDSLGTTKVTHGHGYKPRKYLDKKDEYKRKLTYIYINSEVNKSIWKGIIEL